MTEIGWQSLEMHLQERAGRLLTCYPIAIPIQVIDVLPYDSNRSLHVLGSVSSAASTVNVTGYWNAASIVRIADRGRRIMMWSSVVRFFI
jgi:hypothetical protein